MQAKRHRLTRVCMLSAHDKCMGYFDHPIAGQVSCDCPCHETLPTLFTDQERES